MDAFNGWAGLADGVKVGETDMVVQGFSPTFTMLGGIFGADEGNEECYTFLLGQVKQIKDVQIDFGDSSVPFTIVTAETGIGEVPIAVSRDVFDLTKLKVGCVIGLNADVKADLALDDSFTRSGNQT